MQKFKRVDSLVHEQQAVDDSQGVAIIIDDQQDDRHNGVEGRISQISNEQCIIFDDDGMSHHSRYKNNASQKKRAQSSSPIQSPNHDQNPIDKNQFIGSPQRLNLDDDEQIIQNDDNDAINDQRYDSKFFKNMSRHRQGIPTLTAKARQTVNNDIVPIQKSDSAALDRDSVSNHSQQIPEGRFSNLPERRVKHQMNGQLLNELQHIQMHENYRFQVDKFIMLFQKDSNQAFQYLFDNNIIPNDNRKIAQILLTTEGINKDALNKLFGSPNEKNQDIFKEYCQLLDFRGLFFEKALRLLLSRFRLSGEAQQVDRMVKTFAEVYHNDNPTVFESNEDPYILSYSLVMLSTDASSTKIQQKNKMTKQQFVKNNKAIFKNLPDKYFEETYDSITKEPFQITIDYVEQIYNRLSMCHEKLQGDTMKQALNMAFDLMKGSNLLKYGRQGEPKPRKLFLSEDEKRICWRAIDKEEDARYINISEICDLALGCNTTDVMKKHGIPIEFDQFCFSIITQYRTLDVKVNELTIKFKWVNYLRAIIIHRRETECRRAQQNLKRVENEMKREEIWRVDIFPRWEFHWDYQKNRPQNFKKYQSVKKEEQIQKQQRKANQGPSILQAFCSCLKNTIPFTKNHQPPQQLNNQPQQVVGNNIYQQQNQNQDSNIIYQQQIYQDVPFQGKNQSLLLMILWKLGIPDWARKTLWPISIGNRIEFTESLYNIILKQVFLTREGKFHVDKWIKQAFQKIQMDLTLLKNTFKFLEDEGKATSLCNILESFVFYRPDFGYIQGMGNLAAMLIFHLGEYEAMQSFVNLIHSFHFLPLFKGDMREIEWRVRFFDENLQRILPLVYNHFKALDLSSELFLIKWFMTLFSNSIPFSMLSRIWDNFFLEGEIYMFRSAIAFIKYFQLELKMSPFDEAISILKNDLQELNEDFFFILTDEVPIKEEEYKKFIELQKVALLNTQIHVALLQQ